MLKIFLEAFNEWRHGRASNYAAALAFYALFALAPIIIIMITVAGAFFGEQAARGEIVDQIQRVVGPEIASAIQVIVENAKLSGSNILFAILSFLVFLFAASRIITSLKYALNKIWDKVNVKHKRIRHSIKSKVLSVILIVVFDLFFVLLIFVSGILATIWVYLANFLPIGSSLFGVLNLLISFGVITFIIASINKYLPDIEIAWKDVWIGAAVTTILFMIGNYLIGLYIRNVSAASVYGAAGSLVVILIWLYYSFQIFLFGAEFTRIYSKQKGFSHGIIRKILSLF